MVCVSAEAEQCGKGGAPADSADSLGAQLLPHGRAVPWPQLRPSRLHTGPCSDFNRRAGLPHLGCIYREHSEISLETPDDTIASKACLLVGPKG